MRACPFCGYNEGWTYPYLRDENVFLSDGDTEANFRVVCKVCGSEGPPAVTREMAEKKWDGLLSKIDSQDKFNQALNENYEGMDIYDQIANEEFDMDFEQLGDNEQEWILEEIDKMTIDEEAMGGVSSPGATLNNTPGVGTATPASSAGMNADGPSGSGDAWGDGVMYDQNGKVKKTKKKRKSKKIDRRKKKKTKTMTGEVTVNEMNKINEFDYTAWLISAANDLVNEGNDINTVANFIAKHLERTDLYEDILDDLIEYDSRDYDAIEFVINKYSSVNEMNINPYDKIGQMIAKKMGVKTSFKPKGDSANNEVEQEHWEELEEPKFKKPNQKSQNLSNTKIKENKSEKFTIETLDSYQKASKHIPDHPLTTVKKKINEENLRNEEALKDVKAKETLETLGIAYEYKPAESGENRTFIKEPIKHVLKKIKEAGWEEIGKNPENTIRKYKNGDEILTIFAKGNNYPIATVTSQENTSESLIINKMVSNSLEPYIENNYKLTEQEIIDNILSLNEGEKWDAVKKKLKKGAAKGLVSVALLATLINGFSNNAHAGEKISDLEDMFGKDKIEQAQQMVDQHEGGDEDIDFSERTSENVWRCVVGIIAEKLESAPSFERKFLKNVLDFAEAVTNERGFQSNPDDNRASEYIQTIADKTSGLSPESFAKLAEKGEAILKADLESRGDQNTDSQAFKDFFEQ